MRVNLEHGRPACAGCGADAGLDFDFTMAFQPIVDVRRQAVFSYEALVRGVNGEGAGAVLARVNDQNRYRFDQACRTKAIGLAAKLGVTTCLNINFLPNAVYRPEACIRSTLEAARTWSFPVDKIVFEVTEGEAISDHAHLAGIFAEYKRRGFQTAIDDFGAGSSGLNLLAEFQPDFVKLDMALIRHLDRDRVRRAIVRGVVQVCRDLGVEPVGEGVETADEAAALYDLGVHLLQGYHFARPVTEGLPPVAWPALVPA